MNLAISFLLLTITASVECRHRSIFSELAYLLDTTPDDTEAVDDCKFNCQAPNQPPYSKCENGKCVCALGFIGKYCTCDMACAEPYGTCKNDSAGTCICRPGFKGRNCDCPATCPDNRHWKCVDIGAGPDCFCMIDLKPWVPGKKCCPKECTAIGMTCPNDGTCFCSHTNTYFPYGSPTEYYKCCPNWCAGPLCTCQHHGCIVKATGNLATSKSDCGCTIHNSWQECGDDPKKGICHCSPTNPPICRCKCHYGWAGGDGIYGFPGWREPKKGGWQPDWTVYYTTLYAQHCNYRCDWKESFFSQPERCTRCFQNVC